MIEAQGLRKSFGSRRAVDGLSFRARDGEITGLLGPNGAGKTTTLRMLYTLLRPDHGTIQVDGLDARREPLAVRRALGALPDARGLYTRLTARENIEYFALLHGLDRARARARAGELIEALGMRDLEQRRTAGFSQGERVKTAIARALVHDPRNLLLDEPTNGLDVAATRSLREFLRGLRSAGRCVLLSTHLMQEVGALCDRIVVMARGRVVADGTPDELRRLARAPALEDAFMKLIDGAGADYAARMGDGPAASDPAEPGVGS